MGANSSKRTSRRRNYHVVNRQPSSSENQSSVNEHETQISSTAWSDFSVIADNFHTLEQVTEALRESGLESCNLIVGIDFTKSNEWTGKKSFKNRSLHDLEHRPNPYDQALSIIGKTLFRYDEDNLIPCFGFGDVSTHDQMVFSFNANKEPCSCLDEALQRYREIVPHVRLAGPTSFAPIIDTAIEIVENSGGRYHILLVIADGQVTRSVDTDPEHLSRQEKETVDAIVRASNYALSIVVVGVGDGPWDTMENFDDNIPARRYDNIQFVNFTEMMSRKIDESKKEAEFALASLMEIPFQYQATIQLQLLGNRRRIAPTRTCLPPPTGLHHPPSPHLTSSHRQRIAFSGASHSTAPISLTCPYCFVNPRELVFDCGHQSCCLCGAERQVCPFCGAPITRKIQFA